MNDWPTEKLDDLMDRYLFGLLDEAGAGRVRHKIEQNPEWRLAYEAAIRRKQALAEAIRGRAGEAAPARAPKADDVLAAARAVEARRKRRNRLFYPITGGVAAAAVLCIAFSWIYVASITPPVRYLRLLGQKELLAGSVASLRAMVLRFAGDVPEPGVDVILRLVGIEAGGGDALDLARWTTDSSGVAAGQVRIPDLPGGRYTLVAMTAGRRGSRIEVPITIRRAHKVYLATDKPIYQPGQTIHMRTLVLRKPDLRPAARRPAKFTVTDPGGNVIFSDPVTLSDYGIASANLPLDELISPGRYTIKAVAGDDESEQTVEVFHYKLPAFAVKIQLDRSYYLPEQVLSGTVDVRYHFGKPVAGGKVAVELTGRPVVLPDTLRTAAATTDANGRASFRIHLPAALFGSQRTAGDAHLLLSVRVTDAAGQENVGYRTVPVARHDIRLAVVAENGAVQPGLPTRVFIVASYPDGRPVRGIIDVETLGMSLRTDEAGVAVLESANFPDPLRISARDEAGRTGSTEVSLPRAEGDAFILRTDKAIYSGGETVSVEVVATAPGQVFLDVVKDRQAMLTRTLTPTDGRANLALDLPPELAGTLKLHAYRLDDAGEWVGRDALIIVRPSRQLKVAVRTDRDVYRPGEDAKLTFDVTDPSGRPVPAALSLAAVDEAVFSVQQAAPGLEATLLGLDRELLEPAIQAKGFVPSMLARSENYARAALAPMIEPAPPRRSRLAAILRRAGLPPDMFRRWSRNEIREALRRYHHVREELGPEAIAELLGESDRAVGIGSVDIDDRWNARDRYRHDKHSAEEMAEGVSAIGVVVAAILLLLIGVYSIASEVRHRSPQRGSTFRLTVGIILVVVTLAFFISILMPGLSRSRELARRASVGSDLNSLYKGMVLADAVKPSPYATVEPEDVGPVEGDAKVRTYFPETMLWRPEVITDARGRAELTVPLADSITTWRVSGSAVSRAGQLGAVDSSVRVFQEFFADVDAPLALTQGDEVSVPLVLYNYTGGDLEVSLRIEAGGGLKVLDGAVQKVTTAAGQVKRTYVRVLAESIGEGTLTVHAAAGPVRDAVRRAVRIAPPGLPQATVVNGTIGEGGQVVDLLIPPDAVPGSVAVRMKAYPSTFSELLDGLDGIFRMPHGCFEQTSSTTYPNVMALAYMKANGIETPEVAAKARRYIHLGYQRLLSFEASGGGFSLYGRSPANVPLTAYGLMEFADMAKVHNVDPAILSRTAAWLAGRQNADGSWSGYLPMSRARRGGNLAITAYVTWAMASCDRNTQAVRRGAGYLVRNVGRARDPHTLALCANALLAAEPRHPAARAAADRLASMAQRPDKDQAWWSSRGAVLSYGRGPSGNVETTALAALALIRSPEQRPLVVGALRWLAARKDPYGTWGTTQATVLALKAMLEGSGLPAGRERAASITVALADATLGHMTIRPEQSEAVHAIRLAGLEKPGIYRLRVAHRDAAGMAYQFVVHYHSTAAVERSAARDPLEVTVRYDRAELETGGTVAVRATVSNHTDAEARMLLVDIGIPPGFSVRPAGLDKLVEARAIDRYTLTARGVIVYLAALPPRRSVSVDFEMVARLPLRAVAPPTRAYEYYRPERIAAAAPGRIVVR